MEMQWTSKGLINYLATDCQLKILMTFIGLRLFCIMRESGGSMKGDRWESSELCIVCIDTCACRDRRGGAVTRAPMGNRPWA